MFSGIFSTVEQFHEIVKETFGLTEDFPLYYLDENVGDYFTLHSSSQIKHKGTISVGIILSVVLPLTKNQRNVSNLNDSSSSPADPRAFYQTKSPIRLVKTILSW